MILRFFSKQPQLLSLSQYINTLQNLAITNLCPLWQEFLHLSKQLICQDWHAERQPWAYKTWMQGGGNRSFLPVQLLCFNAQGFDTASPTPLLCSCHPVGVCWRPVSTWTCSLSLLTRVCWAHQAHERDREVDGEKRTKPGNAFFVKKGLHSPLSDS